MSLKVTLCLRWLQTSAQWDFREAGRQVQSRAGDLVSLITSRPTAIPDSTTSVTAQCGERAPHEPFESVQNGPARLDRPDVVDATLSQRGRIRRAVSAVCALHATFSCGQEAQASAPTTSKPA